MNKIIKIIEAKYIKKDNSSINVKLEHKDARVIEYCFLPNQKDESLDAEIRELLKDFTISPYVESIAYINKKRLLEINKQLQKIDYESQRPNRAINLAFVNKKVPNENDVAKLQQLEDEAQLLRVEREELVKEEIEL